MTIDGADAESPRRLLVVSYHFGAQGATGGFRWSSMAPALCERGWTIDVITGNATPADHHAIQVFAVPKVEWPSRFVEATIQRVFSLLRRPGGGSPSEVEQVDQQADALKPKRPPLPSPEPHGARAGAAYANAVGARSNSLKSRVAQLLDLIDMLANILWAFRARRTAKELFTTRRYTAVLVSTPPHEHQLLGLWIGRRAAIPTIADLRDPWFIGVPAPYLIYSSVYRTIGTWMERRIHRGSSVVVHNTEQALASIERFVPGTTNRRIVIANGYDSPRGTPVQSSRFEILFAGHLYWFMDPRVLFRAVRRFLDLPDVESSGVRLVLLGSPAFFWRKPMLEWLEQYGLGDSVDVLPRVSREEALARQQAASVLVVLDCPHPLSVPMKFYDYLVSPGDLLLLSQRGSALETQAKKIGLGIVPDDDDDAVLAAILRSYHRWRSGELVNAHDLGGVHSRRARSEQMHQLLEMVREQH